jgi:hypothetical protein
MRKLSLHLMGKVGFFGGIGGKYGDLCYGKLFEMN